MWLLCGKHEWSYRRWRARALLERVDDDQRTEALARVHVFGVEFVAAGLDCRLYDHRVPKRQLRFLLKLDCARQQASGVLNDRPVRYSSITSSALALVSGFFTFLVTLT